MDSGGKGRPHWLCQAPAGSPAGSPGVERPALREPSEQRPEPGVGGGGGARPCSTSIREGGIAGERGRHRRGTPDSPEKEGGRTGRCSGRETWVSPAYGWCLGSRTPGPEEGRVPARPAQLQSLRHLSCPYRGAGGSREVEGFAGHAFPKAWRPSPLFAHLYAEVSERKLLHPASRSPLGWREPLEACAARAPGGLAHGCPALHACTLLQECFPPPVRPGLPLATEPSPTPRPPFCASQVLDISPLFLSRHPASAPTQVQPAGFLKGKLKSGLYFCVKWPDF